MAEADAAQGADQDIGHRGEPQPQLIGAHRVGRGAVGIEIELAFLDAVFHLAAGAIELLVEVAGLVRLTRQRSDDKAWVGLALGPFRLGDDPALAAASARLGCGALTGPVASRFRQPAPPRVSGAIPPSGHLSLSRVYVSDIDVWRTVKTAAWIRSGAGIRSP